MEVRTGGIESNSWRRKCFIERSGRTHDDFNCTGDKVCHCLAFRQLKRKIISSSYLLDTRYFKNFFPRIPCLKGYGFAFFLWCCYLFLWLMNKELFEFSFGLVVGCFRGLYASYFLGTQQTILGLQSWTASRAKRQLITSRWEGLSH